MNKFLKTVLPWVGAAATSGIPGLIGMAAKTVAGVIGKDVKADPDAIAAAVAGATPEQLAQMKAAEQGFQLQLQAAGFQHEEELEKLNDDDRANARSRQITLRDRIPAILAIGVTLGFFGMLVLVMWHKVPDSSRDLANIMLGSLGSSWAAIVAYYFGSSAGSDKKSELLAAK